MSDYTDMREAALAQAIAELQKANARIAELIRLVDACACGQLTQAERDEATLEAATELRERAEKVEREFLNGPDRVRGKIISLGARMKHPRTYEQDPGAPLHPSTADCYAGATDDGRGPDGAA